MLQRYVTSGPPTKSKYPGLASGHRANLVDAMCLLSSVWKKLPKNIIERCWQHSTLVHRDETTDDEDDCVATDGERVVDELKELTGMTEEQVRPIYI